MSLRPAVVLVAAFLLVPRAGDSQDAPPKLAGVDVPAPKRTKSVAPQYPPEAQALGMRGIVILELLVGPDGKVVSARVTRSVPPFDDAALIAVRQWEYEITKVEGNPVSVILTVPIEFKMRMPEMARDEGIPELRQGVAPGFPAGVEAQKATVTAEVTLDADGHVAEAHIKSGDSPWAEALFQALRTWRFTPLDGPQPMAFEVRADFASDGKAGPRVDLRLTGARRLEAPAVAAAAPSPSPEPSPAPTSPEPAPAPSPSPSPTVAALPPAPPEELIRNPAGGNRPPPVSLPPVTAAPASPAPASPAPGEPEAPAAVPTPAPTPAPPAPAISAVRDVTLAAGLPDLIRGRRPVAPPLARMNGISGTVEVHFAVDAAGAATVREVAGPDPLNEAARQTVTSWSFRRTTPERLFLAATFTYNGDTAAAAVRSQE